MYEYYQILGIKNDATDAELKKAYRALAKKYHPDHHPDDLNAQKKIQEINDAYSVLGDPEKRKKYDAEQISSGTKGQKRPNANASKTTAYNEKPDFGRMQDEFERFFGFQPKSGEITNEDKLKTKNPLDTSELFEKFMGFK